MIFIEYYSQVFNGFTGYYIIITVITDFFVKDGGVKYYTSSTNTFCCYSKYFLEYLNLEEKHSVKYDLFKVSLEKFWKF